MIGIMALSGIVMVAAIFVTLHRVMDMRAVLGYATEIDIMFSVALIVMFSGTYLGLLSAAFAGLTLAICLSVGRFIFGYKRFRIVRYGRRVGVATVVTPPAWKDRLESTWNIKHRLTGVGGLRSSIKETWTLMNSRKSDV